MEKPSVIIKSALLVAILDIGAALLQQFIKTGKNPEIVLKFIASGLFGMPAFSAGPMMSVYGLVLHFFIAFGFTLLFFLLVAKFPGMVKNVFLTGIVYGIFTWLVMQFLVLPVSKAPAIPLTLTGALLSILIIIVCIGIPLTLIARKRTKAFR
ncbi:MAG TPA: hypothetical protein VM935_14485 [Chitinophagaceae bacterium]|nr:hypothetical protein [Chitinophagaceae bacterium]